MPTTYHLLLIEDDPAVAQSLRNGLECEGYTITWKANGNDGLACAQSATPHLILLDIRLPDGSGFDFCRQMRQRGLRQPVIMLTAQADDMDKILGLEMGADDYVTKPFNLRELLSRIRAQLRRAYGEFSSADANLLFVGDLVIDLARSQASRGNELLNLTPIEFRLLVYLARHRGQALSREQIVSGDAPQLRTAFENLLDNAIKFTPPAGTVRLHLETQDAQALLSVEDTGIGIPTEDLPTLFQRFHRGRNAATYPGNGLGLAIVAQIAHLHAGNLRAANRRENSGARFTLQIPLAH